ncbi:hypothetical protein MCOR02_012087 [Pyricularia oryzae]|nr:hypothetical protein MCOR02_012087 [Pyricularia oryzae]
MVFADVALDIPEAGRRARGPGIASLQVTYAFYYCQPQTKKRKADLLQKYPCDPGCQWKRRSRFGPMTSDKHPFSALMIHLPKSLQVPESAPFGCIAEGPLQQCEWVSRLLIQTYRGTFLIDNAIVYVDHSAVANKEMGISKILERLKDFRHGNNKVNNLVARDNRSNAIPLPLEASSVADASHNLPYLPERTSNPNPMAPPTALLVPTTLETTSSTALSIIPLSQIMPPAKRHREADTSEKEPRITPEDFTVGWICALPIELAAAAEIMDEEFADLPSPRPTLISTPSAASETITSWLLARQPVRWARTKQLLWPAK